jgi:hypothetical protein
MAIESLFVAITVTLSEAYIKMAGKRVKEDASARFFEQVLRPLPCLRQQLQCEFPRRNYQAQSTPLL